MTAELSEDIEILCHARGLDVHTHPSHALYLAWCVCDERWGADSGAAKGCLLALVREAWDRPHASPVRMVRGMGTSESRWRPGGSEPTPSGGYKLYKWGVTDGKSPTDSLAGWSDTELESLVAALEAAP